MPSLGKRMPFTEAHLKGFETVYGADAKSLSIQAEMEASKLVRKTRKKKEA